MLSFKDYKPGELAKSLLFGRRWMGTIVISSPDDAGQLHQPVNLQLTALHQYMADRIREQFPINGVPQDVVDLLETLGATLSVAKEQFDELVLLMDDKVDPPSIE